MPDLNEAPAELDALDRIGLEASIAEGEADAAEQAILNPEPENPIDQAAIWAQIPAALGGILAIAMPELAAVYTPDKCQAWGQGMAAVADKYGWDAAESVGRFAPEISLVVVSIPLVIPTISAVKAFKAKADAKAKEVQISGAAAPENAPAEPINPMHLPPGGFVDPI